MSWPDEAPLEVRLEALLDQARVNSAQRFELRRDPVLAIELLDYALARPKIRKPAAYVVDRFRRRRAPSWATPSAADAQEDAPTLDQLEFAWSVESMPAAALYAIGDAIAAHGGFARLKPAPEDRAEQAHRDGALSSTVAAHLGALGAGAHADALRGEVERESRGEALALPVSNHDRTVAA